MKRFTVTLALMACLIATASFASSATAAELPQILPESGSTRTWTGASEGTAEFNTTIEGLASVIKCPEATAEGTEESKKPLGLFHIHFLGCFTTLLGKEIKCTDLNHNKETEAGSILLLGTWHLVWDRKNGAPTFELTTGILLLIESAHLSCGATLLIKVEGLQLCLDLKPTEASKTHSFHCIAEGAAQTEEWCKKDNAASECLEPVKPVLKFFINESPTATTSAILSLGNVKTSEELFADI